MLCTNFFYAEPPSFYKFVNLISVSCQLGATVDQYGPKLNFPQNFQFNLQ
jgi:hypothetical protein